MGAVFTVALSLLVGCGEDDDVVPGQGSSSGSESWGEGLGGGGASNGDIPEACVSFEPCGGDLTGSWKLVSGCGVGGSPGFEECRGYSSVPTYDGDLTYVFQSGGVVKYEGEALVEVDVRVSDACAAKQGLGGAASVCESYEQTEAVDYTCTTTADLCECTRVSGPIPAGEVLAPEPESYETSGTQVTLTVSSGDEIEYSYCVSDDTLVVGAPESAHSPYLVFVRD
jgi:hypothetical protein